MGRREWLAARSREFASLRGRHVESWVGVEMAVRDTGPDDEEPQFWDLQVPCLQLFGLHVSLDGGAAMDVSTYQDDRLFGLRPHPERGVGDGQWDGIYRRRALAELPIGEVEQVAVLADEGVLAEVHLCVGGRPVLLVAGELDETTAGGLLFHRRDESVLVFTNPAAVEAVPWTTSRRGLARFTAEEPRPATSAGSPPLSDGATVHMLG